MSFFRKHAVWAMLLVPLFATAGSPTEQGPLEVVRRGNAEVEKLLNAKADADTLAGSIEKFVDFGELARRALKDTWKELSKKQQAEFEETMKGLLKATYVQKTGGGASHLSNARIEREELRATEASVHASVQSGKTRIPVEYRLYKKQTAWLVFDIVTDEVSLVQTYEEQFRRFLSTRSYEELLKTLQSKREQLEQAAKEKKSS